MNARPADAVGNFRKQFQLIQPMVDADPRDIDMRTRLILSRASIGNALVEAGQRSEGLPLLMRSLSDAELLAKSASDALDRTILAFIEVWVGEALEKSGDYGGALRYYSLAFQRYSAIIAADPQDLEDKVNVAAVSAHLARTHIKRGEMKEAAEQSRNALAQAESAVSTSPEDMEALYALADSYAGTGEVAVMMARNTTSAEERSRYWNDARGSYQMSLNVWQRIPNPSKIAPNGFEVTDLDDVTRARAQCNLEIGALTISGNKPQ
jgi:tetratricopeptide (TPR) repeat protein